MRTEPVSKFLKVKCLECNNEQIIFGKGSTSVKCLVCNAVLAKPTGGRVELIAEVVDTF